MEFSNIRELESAAESHKAELVRIGIGLMFMCLILIYVSLTKQHVPDSMLLAVAAIIGGYMAMNIGANDVANNVGPAVGSKALTLTGAILIAAIFEAAGALIAGGDVVSTIKKGIIDPSLISDPQAFVWLMMAALLAGALWLNLATWLGAPVSTTHSIVGGVLGAGIAAGGLAVANWEKMGAIAASWVISPVMGGIIAAAFLFTIKKTVMYRQDMLAAARRVVPVLIAVMAMAFTSYLVLKGIKKIWKTDVTTALIIGVVTSVVIYLVVRPMIARKSRTVTNDRDGVNALFTIPLIVAAALLSFAHGANDVANAIGPLAAINDALQTTGISGKAAIPLWVMMVGALGIALGLALFGPKLIKTVGTEITELDKSRAFCVAMAAAITVIIATQLGLPVSSTHIAVGGVFGVGFLREYLKSSYAAELQQMVHHHEGEQRDRIERFLKDFNSASIEEMERLLQEVKKNKAYFGMSKNERKGLKRLYREQLVKRSALYKIAAAWIITVPASALLAALLFFTIRGMLI